MGDILYAGAIHRVNQAKIDGERLTQAAHNERQGAESELARFSAALNNNRRMDAAGAQIENIQRAIARNSDAKAAGDLNGQIAVAEELGSSATMAAAAGVGGSSIAAYNRTIRLRSAMGQEEQNRAFASDTFAAGEDIKNTELNAVSGLDNNSYRASLDYTKYVDDHKMSLFQRIATVGLAAAATYYGGPQAGMAVIGMSEAKQAADNGDYAGAGQAIEGAVQNGVGGFKAARTTGFNGFFNTAPAPVPQLPTMPSYSPPPTSPYAYGTYGYGGYGSTTLR